MTSFKKIILASTLVITVLGAVESYAAEMTIQQKQANSAGFMNAVEGLCPGYAPPPELAGSITLIVKQVAADPSLLPYYDDGVKMATVGMKVSGKRFCEETIKSLEIGTDIAFNTLRSNADYTTSQKKGANAAALVVALRSCKGLALPPKYKTDLDNTLIAFADNPEFAAAYKEGFKMTTDIFALDDGRLCTAIIEDVKKSQ